MVSVIMQKDTTITAITIAIISVMLMIIPIGERTTVTVQHAELSRGSEDHQFWFCRTAITGAIQGAEWNK